MKIPIAKKRPPDIHVPRGPRKGTPRHYKMALLNTLIHLRPKICLEIGTWKGGSALIFEHYFEHYQPHGVLVTADVRKYTNVASKRVRQVIVYPHSLDVCKHYSVEERHLLPNWRNRVGDSVTMNADILFNELVEIEGFLANFDFAFIDGDHENLLRDLEIVEQVGRPPYYTLLDDTQTGIWECGKVYHEQVKHEWNHYDFEDWDVFTGTSLIWR